MVKASVIEVERNLDLALLKITRNPFKGEVRSGVKIQGKEVLLDVGVVKLSSHRYPDGTPVAISGYPLNETILISSFGWMSGSWGYSLSDSQNFFIYDSYWLDLTNNKGNSGGPAYLAQNGVVFGVCVGSKKAYVTSNAQKIKVQKDGKINTLDYLSGITKVIPARYVIELLKRNNVAFEEKVF